MNERVLNLRGALILAILFTLVAAPPVSGESLLELAPPGEPMLPYDAHTLALGGAAESRWHLESGLPSNPAQLVAIEGITFSTVIQVRRAFRELEGGEWDETRQDFPAFQISASLPWNLRLGAGFRSDLRARGSFSEFVAMDLGSYGSGYTRSYSQSGGLSRFPLSLAMPIGDTHRIGVGLNLYRGNRNQEWVFDFPGATSGDPDLGYQDRRVRQKARWAGTGFVLGAQSRLFDARATVSARWEGPADLAGDVEGETAGEDDLEVDEITGRMPARWALGFAFKLPAGGLASVQWEHEAWGDYSAPLPSASLSDVNRYGLGLEWLWGEAGRPGRRHRQFPVRLGLRRGNWPASDPVTGGEITETTFSLGTGFDVQEGKGSVDLTFYWQQIAVDGDEGERRLGLALSLRTSERWKKRTQPF